MPTTMWRRPVSHALILAATAFGTARAADEADPGRGLGASVPNVALHEAAGVRVISLSELRADRKAVVLTFTGIDCPVGDLYLPRLAELARRFEPRGVSFVAINSNASESADQVAEHARSLDLPFPVMKDEDGRIARTLQVERTCETLVLDGAGTLRYRGAIDDQYGLGVRKERPVHHHLADALDSMLADKPIETAATSVVGCPIEFPPGAEPTAARARAPRIRPAADELVQAYREIEGDTLPEIGEVTYSGQVAAILEKRCQSCHRPGQVGPFPLLTFEDARRRSAGIYEVVEDRRMPPWHADPRHGRFENDRHLTPTERATLLAWIEQGTPPGDPVKSQPVPSDDPDAWGIGAPDVVFQIPGEYTVKAEGVLPYQRFRVPTNFAEDRWVQAAEARPGDRNAVHHIIIYVDEKRSDAKGRPQFTHLCGYAPGDMPSVYPDGIAKLVPAGADLIFEIHYTPTGRIKVDRSEVGLVFAKAPVERVARTHGIANPKLAIPPNASRHQVTSRLTVQEDAILLSFMPHMHLRGRDFKYEATFPDGRKETLLSVPAYDFNWQTYYRLAEPMRLPKGTTITCTAHYDNSEGNPLLVSDPKNEDQRYSPDREVRWGEQTWDEMMIGYVDYIVDRPIEATQPSASRAGSSTVRFLLNRAARSLTRGRPASGSARP